MQLLYSPEILSEKKICDETKAEADQHTLERKTSDWLAKSRLHTRFLKAEIDFATPLHSRRQLANLIFSFFFAVESSKQCLFSLWGHLRGQISFSEHGPLSTAETGSEARRQKTKSGQVRARTCRGKRWKLWLSKRICSPSPRVTTFHSLSVSGQRGPAAGASPVSCLLRR